MPGRTVDPTRVTTPNCGAVFSGLKAQLPRFHFVPLLINDPDQMAVHADTGQRAAQVLDGANGHTQTATLNQQIIEDIGTLLLRASSPGPAHGPDRSRRRA